MAGGGDPAEASTRANRRPTEHGAHLALHVGLPGPFLQERVGNGPEGRLSDENGLGGAGAVSTQGSAVFST